jgi:hypothetical protein
MVCQATPGLTASSTSLQGEIIMAYREDLLQILRRHLPENEARRYDDAIEDILDTFTLFSKKDPPVEFAPRKALDAVDPWIEFNFMVRVLGIERWTVSGESSLSDFWPQHDIEYATGIGTTPGIYVFEDEWIDAEGNKQCEINECEPQHFRETLITKSLEVFGVNPPRWIWRDSLPAIFSYIAKHICDKKKLECIDWHEKDMGVE